MGEISKTIACEPKCRLPESGTRAHIAWHRSPAGHIHSHSTLDMRTEEGTYAGTRVTVRSYSGVGGAEEQRTRSNFRQNGRNNRAVVGKAARWGAEHAPTRRSEGLAAYVMRCTKISLSGSPPPPSQCASGELPDGNARSHARTAAAVRTAARRPAATGRCSVCSIAIVAVHRAVRQNRASVIPKRAAEHAARPLS
jgi:hypothetical protein